MLRVDVVLCPGGDEEHTEVLGSIRIANVTPGEAVADYEVRCGDLQAEVIAHRRSDGWLPLLWRASSELMKTQLIARLTEVDALITAGFDAKSDKTRYTAAAEPTPSGGSGSDSGSEGASDRPVGPSTEWSGEGQPSKRTSGAPAPFPKGNRG